MKVQPSKDFMCALWLKACVYDRIRANSVFVVFSAENPWAKKYDSFARGIRDANQQYKNSIK